MVEGMGGAVTQQPGWQTQELGGTQTGKDAGFGMTGAGWNV
jgi:hypothetical protein